MRYYELSIALKYLTPRIRQLSVSIISLISIIVIALVVWLIVVFFSVTHGLEKTWTEKLISLTAPIRITPKEAYYQSYYHLIDSLSEASDYSAKSIEEKSLRKAGDPYNPLTDEAIPESFPLPLKNSDGSPKDLVKTAFNEINKIKGAKAASYRLAPSTLKLKMVRSAGKNLAEAGTVNFITTPAYLTVFDKSIPTLKKSLIPPREEDVENVLKTLAYSDENIQEESERIIAVDQETYKSRLIDFFSCVSVTSIQSNKIPLDCRDFKSKEPLYGVLLKGTTRQTIFIPKEKEGLSHLEKNLKEKGLRVVSGKLTSGGQKFDFFESDEGEKIALAYPEVYFDPFEPVQASLDPRDIKLRKFDEIQYRTDFQVQGRKLRKEIRLKDARIQGIQKGNYDKPNPFWVAKNNSAYEMPIPTERGEPILIPKAFKDSGVLIGDHGFLTYQTLTTSSLQEQRIPVFVAGFYDPGIFPLGARIILTTSDVLNMAFSPSFQNERMASEGIHVRLDDLSYTDDVKNQITKAFEKEGLTPYFNIESYREYEFTKEIIQQLRSEKNLFTLLATVIIVVACSNIISMLIILVNDKKKEIGILRSMGSNTGSIGLIFGSAGVFMGFFGSVIGITGALFTLRYLNHLVDFISRMQGFDLFSSNIYGDELPSEISFEALAFVILATVIVSLIAGCIPAAKACLMKPNEILRSE